MEDFWEILAIVDEWNEEVQGLRESMRAEPDGGEKKILESQCPGVFPI